MSAPMDALVEEVRGLRDDRRRLVEALRKAVETFDDFARANATLGRHKMANAAAIARDATREALEDDA